MGGCTAPTQMLFINALYKWTASACPSGPRASQILEYSVNNCFRRTPTTQIGCKHPALLVNCGIQFVGTLRITQTAKHQSSWSNGCQRISYALALDVWCGAVYTALECQKQIDIKGVELANGSPITKSSPALTDGVNPNEPARAAAASLDLSSPGRYDKVR